MTELSATQVRILSFLRWFTEQNDYSPAIRDIQAACGISSTSVVHYNLRALERLGHIRRQREIARSIEVLYRGKPRPKRVRVPIIGFISAAQPIAVPAYFTAPVR